jgi:hypothetical protein
MMGSLDPQAAFNILIELPNGYGRHAINDSIDGNDCATLIRHR